jgi:Tol biopolymer transport system component
VLAFGPYEIRAPLGQGGGGEVYRAWDPRLQREVALKVLRERADSDPERLRQFVAEARAASALNHPNIVVVFDTAVEGGTPYIVSEFIDGESLRNEIRRGPIPLKRLLDLATQIADGLAEAHAAGLVHCDLKPENIMVTRGGRVKIVDFGLVRPTGFQSAGGVPAALDSQPLTVPGLLGGTIPYMSPEQARGTSVDFRSDQFSFGLVLYEMATAQPAFKRGTPAETLEAITNDEPVALPVLNPQAPLLLWWIIERCLAKRPEDRYGVTSDLHRDLRGLRDRLPEAVAREARGTAAGKRHVTPVAILVGAAIAAVAGLAIGRFALLARQPDLTGLRFSPLAIESAYEGFPAWSPDGRTVAYASEQDGLLQIFTRRLHAPAAVRITDATADCKYPFWSPDGRRVYYVSLARDRESIWSVPAAGGVPQLVIPDASGGAISPDGQTLAFLRQDTQAGTVGSLALWLANTSGIGTPTRYDRSPIRELSFTEAEFAFSPDGQWLGLSAVPGTIGLPPEKRGWQFWMLPLEEGRPQRKLQSLPEAAPRVSGFAWMADSRHIVLGSFSSAISRSQLWLADVYGDRAWPLAQGTISYAHPSVSPTGDVVFTADEPQYDLVQVPLAGGELRRFVATSRNESDPVWSARANAYAYVTDRSGRDEIWLRRSSSQLSEQPLVTQADFQDRTIMLGAPAFSPDGRRVAYLRNAGSPVWPLRIWYSAVGGGTPVPLLPETHEGYQGPPTWSSDGQWLAFAEWSRNEWQLVKVRVSGDAPTGEPPVVLRTDGVANATPQWSPTGEWITWETEEGSWIVSSSDPRNEKMLSREQWLVHTWSPDGALVHGIRLTDDLRLALVSIDVTVTPVRERPLRDLGPSRPVNNRLKGLSVGPDGRTLVTSVPNMQGDLWLLEGFRPPRSILDRLFRRPP